MKTSVKTTYKTNSLEWFESLDDLQKAMIWNCIFDYDKEPRSGNRIYTMQWLDEQFESIEDFAIAAQDMNFNPRKMWFWVSIHYRVYSFSEIDENLPFYGELLKWAVDPKNYGTLLEIQSDEIDLNLEDDGESD